MRSETVTAATTMARGGLVLVVLLALGCAGERSPGSSAVPATEAAYEPSYAERFRIDRAVDDGDDLVLTVWPPWRDASKAEAGLRYRLVTSDAVSGDDGSVTTGRRVVHLPVRRLVTTSTTEAAHLDLLGRSEVLVGHSELDFVSSPSIISRIEEGLVAEVGGGSGLHPELVLEVEADAVLADFLAQSELDGLAQVEAAGTPIVLVPAFLEASPLGRAEWIVVTGLLVGRFDEAVATFRQVESAYLELRTRVAKEAEGGGGPTVFSGGPWDDVWHVPGGRSYAARFLEDAGARYLWAEEDSAGALPLDIETVYDRALDADVWLYPSSWRGLGEIRRADPRLADFRAFRRGEVWANDRRVNASGGNDFWESGAARPDLVLADLVTIFHPQLSSELLPGHELVYHRRLEETPPEGSSP